MVSTQNHLANQPRVTGKPNDDALGIGALVFTMLGLTAAEEACTFVAGLNRFVQRPQIQVCRLQSQRQETMETSNMKYQALIFDCDGTLADTMPAHYASWKRALEPVGLHFSEQRFYELGGWPTVRIIQHLSDEQGVFVDVEAVADAKDSHYLSFAEQVKPVAPVFDVIERFAGRLPMAVASGSRRPNVMHAIRTLQLHDAFDAVVTWEDVQNPKPHGETYLKASRLLGVRPQACLAFEDTDPGLQSARNAGMDVVDVREYSPSDRISIEE